MTRIVQVGSVLALLFMTSATPLMAQDAPPQALITFSASIGAAVTILGAAFGIAKLGAASVESMARQPEMADAIRGALLLAAALIEGATFFALIVIFAKG